MTTRKKNRRPRPRRPSARRQFLVDCLNLEAAAGVESAIWEYFQIDHLDDNSIFRIANKSRQIAMSWTYAAEAVADAILDQRDSIFVSINREEAAEKIRYAKAVYNHLEIAGIPAIYRDSITNIEFSNGARITSLPGRPPRGRARTNVYLDEYAHVQQAAAIYRAAMPIVSKGGRIRIGSSPLGASGLFWEIYTEQMQAYPDYTRARIPWWATFSFCVDVREAIRRAPAMETAERVERFGNDRIRQLFHNMILEDFKLEYEAVFLDTSTAWITWQEIQEAQETDLDWIRVRVTGEAIDDALTAIDEMAAKIAAGEIERVYYGGLDIGRTRDLSELILIGLSTTGQYPIRLNIEMDAVPFDEQKTVILYVLQRIPILQLWIDRTGLGANLAEDIHRAYPAKAFGATFDNAIKQLWATDVKQLIQQRRIVLPVNKDLAYQLHSIKRLATAGGALKLDTDRTEKHHADQFWALALAVYATRAERQQDNQQKHVSARVPAA